MGTSTGVVVIWIVSEGFERKDKPWCVNEGGTFLCPRGKLAEGERAGQARRALPLPQGFVSEDSSQRFLQAEATAAVVAARKPWVALLIADRRGCIVSALLSPPPLPEYLLCRWDWATLNI